jgi:hypothetical protein
MSLKSVLGFENWNAKQMWKQIREDPERLLLGAFDPVSTKMWGTLLNKDWKDKPIVDQWGGASKYNYGQAEKQGVKIDAAHNMHEIARVIASYFVGSYAGSKLGAMKGQGGGSGGWQDYVRQYGGMAQQQDAGQQQEPVTYENDQPAMPLYEDDERAALAQRAAQLRARIAQLKASLPQQGELQ